LKDLNANVAGINGFPEKKNSQLFAQNVKVLIGISPKNKFLIFYLKTTVSYLIKTIKNLPHIQN